MNRPTATDRDTSRDNEKLSYLLGIGCPERANQPDGEARDRVERWIPRFRECQPPLTDQDVMGLIVLRLFSEYLEAGAQSYEGAVIPVLRALLLASVVVPEAMADAGFLPRRNYRAPIDAPPHVHQSEGKRVHAAWIEWMKRHLDPSEDADDERTSIIRGLARLCCFRDVTAEDASFQKAKGLLKAWAIKEHGVLASSDEDDLRQECWLAPASKLVEGGLLRLGRDGCLRYEASAIRDLARTVQHVRTGRRGAIASGRTASLDATPEDHDGASLADSICPDDLRLVLGATRAAQDARAAHDARIAQVAHTIDRELWRLGAAYRAASAYETSREPGDSLASIARAFGTTVDKLRAARPHVRDLIARAEGE